MLLPPSTTAQCFQYGRLSRPERRFHAPVGLGALVNYSTAADASYYDPACAQYVHNCSS